MHLLGTIISVHFIEKERQYPLKYSKAVPNSKAPLQDLEMTGIYNYLLTKPEEDVCHVYDMHKKI